MVRGYDVTIDQQDSKVVREKLPVFMNGTEKPALQNRKYVMI